MDETEVEVEVACWATRHPEASTLKSKSGNEPWLSFVGKSCTGTLHLGLGGLTWCIEVPLGYHTETDPTDGTRKRQWEPLEYHDTLILQSRNTPFHVSVLQAGRKHGSQDDVILDFSCGLEDEFLKKANLLPDERETDTKDDIAGDLVKELQVSLERLRIATGIPDSDGEGPKALSGTTNKYYVALKKAETLTEILDAIYGLVKFYNKRSSSRVSSVSDDRDRVDAGGEDCCEGVEEEDDEHLFDIEAALKWSNIKDDVRFARDACARALQLSRDLPLPPGTELDDDARSPLKEKLRRLEISHASGSKVEAGVVQEYRPPFADDLELSMSSEDASNVDHKVATHTSDSSSDSEASDSSWEKLDMFDLNESPPLLEAKLANGKVGHRQRRSNWPGFHGSPQRNKRKFQDTTGGAAIQKRLETPALPGLEQSVVVPGQSPLMGATPSRHLEVLWGEELKWCEIDFNDQSFSVECTIRITELLSNAAATALGFDLEHPLRIEIVPNKPHVDSLSWTGAVNVYVSQKSDWHNHVAEEICGLLCVVPNIIQTYFSDQVPIVRSKRYGSRVKPANSDLFIGALRTLVQKLKNIDKGGSCCVCGKGGRRSWFLYMENRRLWVCETSLCQATYSSWTTVSSLDIQEREREEKIALDKVEEEVKNEFPYSDEDTLRAMLEMVYGMNNLHDMNYGQMTRALAKIRLWNQIDAPSSIGDAQSSSNEDPTRGMTSENRAEEWSFDPESFEW